METIEKQEAEIKLLVEQLEKVVGGMEGAVKVIRVCVDEGMEVEGNEELVDAAEGGGEDLEMVDA